MGLPDRLKDGASAIFNIVEFGNRRALNTPVSCFCRVPLLRKLRREIRRILS